MWASLLSLDTRVGPHLVRPFWVVGSTLALVLAGIGLVIGLALLAISPVLGLMVVGLGLLLGAAVFLGVRLTAEAASIVFAQGSVPPGARLDRTA